MSIFRRGPRWLTIATLAGAIFSAGAARAGSVLVKAETGLTLRAKPEPDAKKLASLPLYTLVDLKKIEGEWAQIQPAGGATGWALAKFLSPGPFVTVTAEQLQVRRGPDASQDVIMKVGRHYPLRVLDQANGWLKVEDYEGDRGWASIKLVEANPYVITKNKTTNVRKAPGESSDLVFAAEHGVVFKALEEKEGWIHVRHADGDEGWVSGKIVFGWLDPGKAAEPERKPAPKKAEPKKPAAKKPAAKSSGKKPRAK